MKAHRIKAALFRNRSLTNVFTCRPRLSITVIDHCSLISSMRGGDEGFSYHLDVEVFGLSQVAFVCTCLDVSSKGRLLREPEPIFRGIGNLWFCVFCTAWKTSQNSESIFRGKGLLCWCIHLQLASYLAVPVLLLSPVVLTNFFPFSIYMEAS